MVLTWVLSRICDERRSLPWYVFKILQRYHLALHFVYDPLYYMYLVYILIIICVFCMYNYDTRIFCELFALTICINRYLINGHLCILWN